MSFRDGVNISGCRTHAVEGLASRREARYLWLVDLNHIH